MDATTVKLAIEVGGSRVESWSDSWSVSRVLNSALRPTESQQAKRWGRIGLGRTVRIVWQR